MFALCYAVILHGVCSESVEFSTAVTTLLTNTRKSRFEELKTSVWAVFTRFHIAIHSSFFYITQILTLPGLPHDFHVSKSWEKTWISCGFPPKKTVYFSPGSPDWEAIEANGAEPWMGKIWETDWTSRQGKYGENVHYMGKIWWLYGKMYGKMMIALISDKNRCR